MNNAVTLPEQNTIQHANPNVFEDYDFEEGLNRADKRRFRKMARTRIGIFTKPSLGSRKRKRRALRKAGNITRKEARHV
jgi:hypothetical protein